MNGAVTQHRDVYMVNQQRLGMPDRSGASMLTFTAAAEFAGNFAIGRMGGDVFPNPVCGSAAFAANTPD